MNKIEHGNDLQEILTQALEQMKMDQGDKFDLSTVNLAELSRRTGITRAKLRRLKDNSFIVKPHGRTGVKSDVTVLTGYTGIIDEMLGIAKRYIVNLDAMGVFEPIAESLEYNAVIDFLDANMAGVRVTLTLKELEGECV